MEDADQIEESYKKEVETADGEKILNTENVKIVDYDMNFSQKLLNVLSDPNISYILFMLGLYGDRRETMEQTISLACGLPLDIANFDQKSDIKFNSHKCVAGNPPFGTKITVKDIDAVTSDNNKTSILNP